MIPIFSINTSQLFFLGLLGYEDFLDFIGDKDPDFLDLNGEEDLLMKYLTLFPFFFAVSI